jgi:hypothetical protein
LFGEAGDGSLRDLARFEPIVMDAQQAPVGLEFAHGFEGEDVVQPYG